MASRPEWLRWQNDEACAPFPRSSCYAAHGHDGFSMTISDDGPGLGEGDLGRPMASGPLPPGGGVGLRLVRDLVAGLGGIIRHDSQDGQTRVSVDLPLKGATNA